MERTRGWRRIRSLDEERNEFQDKETHLTHCNKTHYLFNIHSCRQHRIVRIIRTKPEAVLSFRDQRSGSVPNLVSIDAMTETRQKRQRKLLMSPLTLSVVQWCDMVKHYVQFDFGSMFLRHVQTITFLCLVQCFVRMCSVFRQYQCEIKGTMAHEQVRSKTHTHFRVGWPGTHSATSSQSKSVRNETFKAPSAVNCSGDALTRQDRILMALKVVSDVVSRWNNLC